MESLVFLDTHAAIWLYSGDLELFNNKVLQLINKSRICISHIVKLEIKYLNEIGRIKHNPDVIIDALSNEIGLFFSSNEIGLFFSSNSFERIVNQAIHLDFTRDPFDRIIVADAWINNSILISKDEVIKKHYKNTIW